MIQYSEIEKKDLKEIINIYEKYLNSGKYIRKSIRDAFISKDFIGYKACDGERIIGFFTGQGGIAFTYPHPELEQEILEFAAGRKIYTPDGLYVAEEYRNKGIAAELILRMRESIRNKDVELALVELWIYPDRTVPAKIPLKGIGRAVYQKKVPMFYHKLKEYGVKCPICGDDCKCGVLIQLLELKKTKGNRR